MEPGRTLQRKKNEAMRVKPREVWWRAFRFHYTSASFMPGILGGMVAWTKDGEFHAGYFLVVVLGLVLNHVALNMTDDYFDLRHLIDVVGSDSANPYTGGSGTLSAGLIRPGTFKGVFAFCYAIAIGIGVFLGVVRGPVVFVLLGFGFFCAFFYTAPPIQFGYRGFGELAQLVCFGPGIGLGAYYVQTQRMSWEAFWTTLPLGIMLFSMITINEIPDYLEDRKGGKLNLVARFGREAGVRLFWVSLCSAYAVIGIGMVLGKIPWLGGISLLTLPIAWKTISLLRRHCLQPAKMAPANFAMMCTHNITGILLITAHFIVGFDPAEPVASFLPIGTLVLLYAPIARLLWRAWTRQTSGSAAQTTTNA